MNRCIPIIIPAYEPDIRLVNLVKCIKKADLGPVIIVNDGSGKEYDPIFSKAGELIMEEGGVILEHEYNCGKGRALKTAFAYALSNYPGITGVVTADSDGQHTAENIYKVTEYLLDNRHAMILGVRRFDQGGIPWKSRFGNNLTEKVFKYVTGIHISDTQTGLRGIPGTYIPRLLNTKGERFEYEMRMLLEAAEDIEIIEVPIETIYDSKEKHQTHFRPIKDSIKIYQILCERFLKFILASLSSSVLDLILFAVFCAMLKKEHPEIYGAVATVAARVISALYNYGINYRVVFKSEADIASSGVKYAILAIIQMFCSATAITVLIRLFPTTSEFLMKIGVDTILFFISYKIQQKKVFL